MARGGQIDNAFVENQVGLALPGLQQFCLARASFKRDLQAPFDDPDRNHLLARIPRQDTVVERKSLRRPGTFVLPYCRACMRRETLPMHRATT